MFLAPIGPISPIQAPFSEAISITNRYFTSFLSIRVNASLIWSMLIISTSAVIPFSAQ